MLLGTYFTRLTVTLIYILIELDILMVFTVKTHLIIHLPHQYPVTNSSVKCHQDP